MHLSRLRERSTREARRVRALSSGGMSRCRKHPLPNPPPLAGEGARRLCGCAPTPSAGCRRARRGSG
ncbi:hypothetical protein CVM73_18100 [Bradyrhizobium forestalis]|uniref:Uncharacterized protein n=1 Tax=Bradyrhizobium forestalis TaxID=1419263 RepID=A0A2M8R826_9BRAD|nr:hypothetical protein CVM73_18100 [Bradyrhizobium forestalis]